MDVSEIYKIAFKALHYHYGLSRQDAQDWATELSLRLSDREQVNKAFIYAHCFGILTGKIIPLQKKEITEADMSVDKSPDVDYSPPLEYTVDKIRQYECREYDLVLDPTLENKQDKLPSLLELLKIIFPSKYHKDLEDNIDLIRINIDILQTILSEVLNVSRATVRWWLAEAKVNEQLRTIIKRGL